MPEIALNPPAQAAPQPQPVLPYPYPYPPYPPPPQPQYEAPPAGPVGSGLREGTRLASLVTGLTPVQVIVLVFFVLCMGLCIITGWVLWEWRDATIRHETQQIEREGTQVRFTESELDKGRTFTREERTKDRKVIEDATGTMREVKSALQDLTKAVRAKGGNIMDP